MDKTSFFALLDRYQAGTPSPAEIALIEEYYRRLEASGSSEFSGEEEAELKARMLLRIKNKMDGIVEKPHQQEPVPLRKIHRRKYAGWTVAATLFILIATGIYFFLQKSRQATITEVPVTDVQAPATNRAMITLADGKTLLLDEVSAGTVVDQNEVQFILSGEGKLEYNYKNDIPEVKDAGYNTLTNPKGSKVIDIRLTDGSRVWLNAGSSLKYPVGFNGSQRIVEVTGEAYFEVSANKEKPFIVNGQGFQTEVLGTGFNINTYKDEGEIKVTLVEGVIEVKGSPDQPKRRLNPGQQALISNFVKVKDNIDIEEVMAWKNGTFKFNKAGIQAVMKQLERWYDIEVRYRSGVPDFQFVGELDRDLSLLKVLAILEKTGVEFNVENRVITVL